MRNTAQTLMVQVIVVILAIAASAESATFGIRLVQNEHPSPTLFSCELAVEEGKVSITATGYSRPLSAMIWERDHSKSPQFEGHLFSIEDDKLAADFLLIAKHFELCHEGSDMKFVSGGTITKMECFNDPQEPAKKSYYIAVDQSKIRPKLMDYICRDIQMLVVSDALKDEVARNKSLEELRVRSAKLASNISAYTQALSLLEDSHQKKLTADWTKITDLIQFRPNQPPLEKRSRLVRTAHEVLTAACSKRGLQDILGSEPSEESALIIKIGEVRRCRGSFSYPENPDWGFDDVGTSLGLVYPPRDPGLRVGILDWGLERLLLHFLFGGAAEAPTAYDRFSLGISGRDWSIVEPRNFKREFIPNSAKERLQYVSVTSGLLRHLLEGDVPEDVTFIDIKAIAIEDDNWKDAKIDYRIGAEEHVLPLFSTDGSWLPNRRWTDRAYRDVGDYIENRDYFRSRADVMKHNADAGGGQPATRPESK
jgi:hypothetical protein